MKTPRDAGIGGSMAHFSEELPSVEEFEPPSLEERFAQAEAGLAAAVKRDAARPKKADVPLERIRLDASPQGRVEVDPKLVEEYAEDLDAGAELRRIDLYPEGEYYLIGDGWHRFLAYQKRGRATIPALLYPGGREAAVIKACGANTGKAHGKKRSRADAQQSVRLFLTEPGLFQRPNREVARVCEVDDKTVASIRAELEKAGKIPALSQRTSSDGKTYQSSKPKQKKESVAEFPQQKEEPSLQIQSPQEREATAQAAFDLPSSSATPASPVTPAAPALPALPAEEQCDDGKKEEKTETPAKTLSEGLCARCQKKKPKGQLGWLSGKLVCLDCREKGEEARDSLESRAEWTEKQEANRKEKHATIAREAKAAQQEGQLGPFSVLYIDCPWQYDARISEAKAIESKYPTLSLEELRALDIPSITWKHAVLYLWVTVAHALEAATLLEAWGFVYKTQHCWVKEHKSPGLGHWVRGEHELLYVATKGHFPTPPTAERDRSVLWAPRREHSKKPAEMQQLLEEMYPEHPKVEIFAREKKAGWVCLGNEIDGADIRELLKAGRDPRQQALPQEVAPAKASHTPPQEREACSTCGKRCEGNGEGWVETREPPGTGLLVKLSCPSCEWKEQALAKIYATKTVQQCQGVKATLLKSPEARPHFVALQEAAHAQHQKLTEAAKQKKAASGEPSPKPLTYLCLECGEKTQDAQAWASHVIEKHHQERKPVTLTLLDEAGQTHSYQVNQGEHGYYRKETYWALGIRTELSLWERGESGELVQRAEEGYLIEVKPGICFEVTTEALPKDRKYQCFDCKCLWPPSELWGLADDGAPLCKSCVEPPKEEPEEEEKEVSLSPEEKEALARFEAFQPLAYNRAHADSRAIQDPAWRGRSDAELAEILGCEASWVKGERGSPTAFITYHKEYPETQGEWRCAYCKDVILPTNYALAAHYQEHFDRKEYRKLAPLSKCANESCEERATPEGGLRASLYCPGHKPPPTLKEYIEQWAKNYQAEGYLVEVELPRHKTLLPLGAALNKLKNVGYIATRQRDEDHYLLHIDDDNAKPICVVHAVKDLGKAIQQALQEEPKAQKGKTPPAKDRCAHKQGTKQCEKPHLKSSRFCAEHHEKKKEKAKR